MRRGYIQVYTGDSKGKTTAALGLALRAAGAGLKVFIAQFIKKRKCSEHKALERFKDLITVKQYGRGFLLVHLSTPKRDDSSGKGKRPGKSEIDSAKKGLKEVSSVIRSEKYDLVILDEINIAVHYDLLSVQELLNVLEEKPYSVELILTGRYADKKIIEKADLVTEMKEIKHYFRKGVKARLGIEY